MVVDDSPDARDALKDLLERESDIEVVAFAADGERALSAVAAAAPDAVTMDIAMPGRGGLWAIGEIMAKHPVPILVVTAADLGPGSELPFEAIRLGALDLVAKPSVAPGSDGGAELRGRLRRIASVPVVRHIGARRREAPWRAGAEPARPVKGSAAAAPAVRVLGPAAKVVGVAASAGGPAALAQLLGSLPADFPACVAVVQHLPPGFTASFAQFLGSATSLRVSVVAGRAEAVAGTVLVAPHDRHLVAAFGGFFVTSDDPPVGGHRPSATALFRSMARAFGPRAAGVVLTGIGDDGAAGLADLRGAGALTVAQDEASAAVYGMPRAAVDAGAVEYMLPLAAIPGALVRAFGGSG